MKIICIGRNYLEHAKEMGKSITKEPIFFLKPDSSLIAKKQPFFLPGFSDNIHYEVELVYKIKKSVKVLTQFFLKTITTRLVLVLISQQEIYKQNVSQMDTHGK